MSILSETTIDLMHSDLDFINSLTEAVNGIVNAKIDLPLETPMLDYCIECGDVNEKYCDDCDDCCDDDDCCGDCEEYDEDDFDFDDIDDDMDYDNDDPDFNDLDIDDLEGDFEDYD